MVRSGAILCLLLAVPTSAAHAQADDRALGDALVQALKPALPFPSVGADGTPVGGTAEPEWMVRWPDADDLRVEILANPLHAGNRQKALDAEREIQELARLSQRRSQGDYEKAVSDFQRTGRIGEIHEVSLRDEGVAGERYDAESQVTVTVEWITSPYRLRVGASTLPERASTPAGTAAVLRLAGHAYKEPASDGLPPATRYCSEQAWVFVGAANAPSTRRAGDAEIEVSATPGDAARAAVVRITGNAVLVAQVVSQADWSLIAALVAG